MGNGASLLYRCRLCGTIHKPSHAPDGWKTMLHIVHGIQAPKSWGVMPGMRGTHLCADGNLGVSDFIGCEFDKDGDTE